MRCGGERRRTIKRDVRLDDHHVAIFDEASHAAERAHRSANRFIMFRAVSDGERRQNFADLRRVAAKLQTFFLFKTGNKMIRLPKFFGGGGGTGDERTGDAKGDEKKPPADGIFLQRRKDGIDLESV